MAAIDIKEKTKHNFRSKEQWRQLIDAFDNSQLSVTDFCTQHGIAQSGFYNWRKRFREEKQTHSKTTLIELPQTLAQAQTESRPWDMELSSGIILRMRGA